MRIILIAFFILINSSFIKPDILLKDENKIVEEKYNELMDLSDEISRLLYAMIKNLSQ
jgi:hypothetical protein